MPTQQEYNVAKQSFRKLYAQIRLLNNKFQVVDEWSNVVTGEPTFTVNSESDIRRTCSLSLIPTNKQFDIAYGNEIWLDKYFQVFIGIEDVSTKEIVYTNMGIYMIEHPSKVYSITDNTITIQGVDLMAKFTGLRGGNLSEVEFTIKQGDSIRQHIIQILKANNFTRYSVDEVIDNETKKPLLVPNEIKIDVTGTYYDVLVALRDIMPNYEMYFDVDGVFHFHQMPTGDEEQIKVDDDLWKDLLISYNRNYDFDNVKNVIEVFGKTWDIGEFFGENVSVENISTMIFNSNLFNSNDAIYNTMINYSGIVSGYAGYTTTNYVEINLQNIDTPSEQYKTYKIMLYSENTDSFVVADYIYACYDVNKEYIPNSRRVINPSTDDGTLIIADDTKYIRVSFKHNYRYFTLLEELSTFNDIVNNKRYYKISNVNTYSVNVAAIGQDLYNNTIFGFASPYKFNNPYIILNNLPIMPLQNADGSFASLSDLEQNYYVVKYDEPNKRFILLGELNNHAIVKDTNPKSPFYVKGSMGEVRIVLSGGEYDNIYTTRDVIARAKWELYKRCRLQDKVSISCIPIYWLDVNWLAEITLPNKYGVEETNLYMIKNINTVMGVTGVQTIELMRYYPYNDPSPVIVARLDDAILDMAILG